MSTIAELQKNFQQEAESNQEFANFLQVLIHIICEELTFNCTGDQYQFWIKFGLVFAQHEARPETSPAKDAAWATAEENSKRPPWQVVFKALQNWRESYELSPGQHREREYRFWRSFWCGSTRHKGSRIWRLSRRRRKEKDGRSSAGLLGSSESDDKQINIFMTLAF